MPAPAARLTQAGCPWQWPATAQVQQPPLAGRAARCRRCVCAPRRVYLPCFFTTPCQAGLQVVLITERESQDSSKVSTRTRRAVAGSHAVCGTARVAGPAVVAEAWGWWGWGCSPTSWWGWGSWGWGWGWGCSWMDAAAQFPGQSACTPGGSVRLACAASQGEKQRCKSEARCSSTHRHERPWAPTQRLHCWWMNTCWQRQRAARGKELCHTLRKWKWRVHHTRSTHTHPPPCCGRVERCCLALLLATPSASATPPPAPPRTSSPARQ